MVDMELSWNKLISSKRLGAQSKSDTDDIRTEFERDWDRVVFSAAFRRMQDKTQVFPIPKSNFVHNRLTHSIEVASIGRSLGRIVGKRIIEKIGEIRDANNADRVIDNNAFGDIVAAACLCHDIGNPPFGHSGERSVQLFFERVFVDKYIQHFPELSKGSQGLEDFLKFEGNAEGLRIVANDHPSGKKGGIRLTYSTVAAFCKYPRLSTLTTQNEIGRRLQKRVSQKKFGVFVSEKDVLGELVNEMGLIAYSDGASTYSRHPLAFLVEAADNIAYQIMDLEDGHKLGLIEANKVVELLKPISTSKEDNPGNILEYEQISDPGEKIGAFRAKAINGLIFQCADAFMDNYEKIMTGEFDQELTDVIRQSAELGKISELKPDLFGDHRVVSIEAAGRCAIGWLLDFYVDALVHRTEKYARNILNMLPDQYFPMESDSDYVKIQKLTTYVSRMTDRYAMDQYLTFTGHKLPEII